MRLIIVVGFLIVVMVAILGIVVALRLLSISSRTERPSPLTPDAERDARAKFMPSSDTAANDPSIQPDKRNVKSEGKR
jgi:hypothetical protein